MLILLYPAFQNRFTLPVPCTSSKFRTFIGEVCLLKINPYILLLFIGLSLATFSAAQKEQAIVRFDFYGDSILLPFNNTSLVPLPGKLEEKAIQSFVQTISQSDYSPVINALLAYKTAYKLDDWLFYQLVRKTAQQVSPKADNYYRYTLYKWFLLTRSGYDAILAIAGDQLLFYVQSDENIYNIPYRVKNGRQYICLNYHDYGSIDFENVQFRELALPAVATAKKGFSYKISHLPNFRPDAYLEKDIRFNFHNSDYYFKIKLNPEVKTIFSNYPVVDYESYFNIPLSRETYQSLIPVLKQKTQKLSIKKGIDFLVHFTREAFLFEPDSAVFGAEKRLSPEQTLLYEQSDCEDRAALFFYLVKEIYNLPMIVLSFPRHVTIAVHLKKPVGKPILYNGKKYTVCEPTPQKDELGLGQLPAGLQKQQYEIAYSYTPGQL